MEVEQFTLTNSIQENVLGLQEDHYYASILSSHWNRTAEWMYEVHRAFRTTTKSFFLSVYLFNEVISRVNIIRGEIQLAAVTCMLIAENQQEGYHPDIDDYIDISADTYTHKQIEDMRNNILILMNGRVRPPTVYDVFMGSSFDNNYKYEYEAIKVAVLTCIYVPSIFSFDIKVLCKVCLKLANDLAYNISDDTIREDDIEASILSVIANTNLPKFFINEVLRYRRDLLDWLEDRKGFCCAKNLGRTITRRQFPTTTIQNVEERERLGKGTYGSVKLVKKNGNEFARKKQEIDEAAFRELSILSTYYHPNIVTMYSFSIRENTLYMDLELGITLYDLIYTTGDRHVYWEDTFINGMPNLVPLIDIWLRRKYQTDILKGFEYLHSYGIIHRDLKPKNIIVVGDTAKIIDFGLAYSMLLSLNDTSIKDTEVYTLNYRPMELLWKPLEVRDYGFEADVWSIGALFLEMETGLVPFYHYIDSDIIGEDLDSEETVIWCISFILGSPIKEGLYVDFPYDHEYSGLECVEDMSIKRLILDMLLYDRKERLMASEALGRI